MRIDTALPLRFALAIALFTAWPAHALQGGNVQPEYLQFEPAESPDMVSLMTGDFSYTLPLGEVPGPYGSYPLSMSYHAGIGPNQEATWVGLGWSLNPGAINRNLRGVPDDQFHGGDLSYIYSYATSSNWGVYTGYSYGVFSVNSTYNSNSGYGITFTAGLNIGNYVSLGASYSSEGFLTLDASVGMKGSGVGIQGSITFGPDGYAGSSVGIMAYGATQDGGTASASIGVHHTSGRGMAASTGFGYTPKAGAGEHLNSKGQPMVPSRRTSSVSISDGNISLKGYGYGTSISMPGSATSIGSSNGASESKHSSTGVGIVIPTYVGIFSAGYTRNIDETWVRQATSEHLYGYMYQAGPAIFSDTVTSEMPIAPGSGGSTNPNGWRWNYKGKSLDRLGNPVSGDLLPAYDLYNVSANGLSGTFRPYALTRHSLFESVEKLASDDLTAQTLYYLMKEDGSGKQTADEFGATPTMTGYAYDYCYDAATKAASFSTLSNTQKMQDVIDGRCSRYAILASSHLNESNRLVLSSDPYSNKYLRSRMMFRFMGESGGNFSSEDRDWKGSKYGQFDLQSKLFQNSVNGVNYALFGSRRIDPILENNLNNGRLQGFRITNPDGTQYFFTQPVRSIVSADYTTNRAKGSPLFVDQSAPGSGDHFWNVIGNGFKTFWRMAGNAFQDPLDGLKDLAGWYIALNNWGPNTVKSFVWDSPIFKDKCQSLPDEQYNFSYSMKVNPYATQWLLTEVRGPEFVELNRADMTKNIGYQVKFTYNAPTWYKWRFPFAPPNTDQAELPNFRLPKNARTPENCNSDVYNGSFGVKEMVYLKSIETSTHRADFVLNDPATDSRIDGKGWIQDWTGRTQNPASTVKKATAMPIYLDTRISLSATATAGGWTTQCNDDIEDNPDTEVGGTIVVGKTCWWRRGVTLQIDGAYLNVMPTDTQVTRVKNKQVSIVGFEGGRTGTYGGSDGQQGYPTGFTWTGFGEGPMLLANNQPPAISNWVPASGQKLLYGSSIIQFASPIVQSSNFDTGFVSCSGDGCTPTLGAQPASFPASFTVGEGKGSTSGIQPLLVYNDFVETSGPLDNQMRFLKSVRILEKTGNVALRQFEFDYDNNISPGTLNSYPTLRDVGGNADLVTGYPKVKDPTTNTPNASLEGLDGKLKLNSIREVACLSADCSSKVPMPPFRFYYKDEAASSLKMGEDFFGSIIASSNPQDEWGFWNVHATEENHKVRQDFADKGAVTWSMDKVVDPAGGQLEVEYERDRYKGENYADETKGFPVSWHPCPNSLGRDPKHLCIDVLPRRWVTYCNRNDQLEGEYAYNYPTTTTDADYAYLLGMTQLGVPATPTNLYFQLDGTYEFNVRCGAKFGSWRSNHCPRHRSIGMLGSGNIVRIVEDKSGVKVPFLEIGSDIAQEVRSIEINVPYEMVYNTMIKAGEILTDRGGRGIEPNKGLIWVQRIREDIKGGDLRVSKLIKRDIGLVQTTKYDYAPGEMAQYPDSVISSAFAERYSPVKSISVMPLTYLPGLSRVPGINDDEASFLPSPTITYPKVTVTNISKTADTVYNGRTIYEFITPETGVPLRAGGPDPFVKVRFEVSQDAAVPYGTMSLQFKDSLGANIGTPVSMTHQGKPHENIFTFESVDPSAPYKNADSVQASYVVPGKGTYVSKAALRGRGEVIKEYADVSLTAYFNPAAAPALFVLQLADYRGSRYAPILVRTSPVGSASTNYSDYVAFLGKAKNTEFHRWIPSGPSDFNDRRAPVEAKYRLIKGDSTVYSAVAPSADNRFYSQADSRKALIGKDEDKWEYTRKIHCNDTRLPTLSEAGVGPCDFANTESAWHNYDGIEATVNGAGTAYAPKQMTYIRNPAFVVETISKTGFNGSTGPSDYIVSRVTNHRFDPLTGQATLSASFTSRAGQAAPAKATRNTPAYTVPVPLAATMFEKNMLVSMLREDKYTWTVAPTLDNTAGGTAIDFDAVDPSGATVFPDRLTSVNLTPFTQGDPVTEPNFPNYAGASGAPRPIVVRDNPILGIGAFSPRFDLTSDSGKTKLSDNVALFSPRVGNGTFLKNWSGKQIVSVNDWFKPKEERDVYGYGLSHRYDPTGFHKIGLFGNAGYAETAILTAEGRAGNTPDISAADGWRFTGGAPVPEDPFLKLAGNFSLSHALQIAAATTYLVEAQLSSTAARSCQVQFYTDAGAAGDSKNLALTPGLSTYQVVLDASAYTTLPGSGNRVRLTCQDGGGGTVRLAYLRAYPERGEALSYVYDARGRMVQSVNEQNVSSYYEYDAFGNLIAMRNDDGVLYSTHKRELVNVATP
jgi:YD repeat-containing protein